MRAQERARLPPSSTFACPKENQLEFSAPLLLFSSRVHDRCRAQQPRENRRVVHSERKLNDWSAIVTEFFLLLSEVFAGERERKKK
jgi:hypothetical protein